MSALIHYLFMLGDHLVLIASSTCLWTLVQLVFCSFCSHFLSPPPPPFLSLLFFLFLSFLSFSFFLMASGVVLLWAPSRKWNLNWPCDRGERFIINPAQIYPVWGFKNLFKVTVLDRLGQSDQVHLSVALIACVAWLYIYICIYKCLFHRRVIAQIVLFFSVIWHIFSAVSMMQW